MKDHPATVVVIGAANIDIFARPNTSHTMYDSNPGHVHIAHGGVGRNIVENLARLDMKPLFLTALAGDMDGVAIRQCLEDLGATVCAITHAHSNRYVAMLDQRGELLLAVADMAGLEVMDADFLHQHRSALTQASSLVLDANLPDVTWSWLIEHVATPIYADAISVAKADRLKPYRQNIHTLKVNRFEASVLSGEHPDAPPEMHIAALLGFGITEVFLTLGEHGAMHGSSQGIRHMPSFIKQTNIVNATGAGDAFMSGVIYANQHKKDSLTYGLAMSSISLRSRDAVSPALNVKRLEDTVKEDL
ncbi:MAG: hypothetical protein EA374_06315 [Acholeplasmatales bacterium]|nr:MAG: hypothetical protein EA374_06315 [Acholeplasmatales bacterium]